MVLLINWSREAGRRMHAGDGWCNMHVQADHACAGACLQSPDLLVGEEPQGVVVIGVGKDATRGRAEDL